MLLWEIFYWLLSPPKLCQPFRLWEKAEHVFVYWYTCKYISNDALIIQTEKICEQLFMLEPPCVICCLLFLSEWHKGFGGYGNFLFDFSIKVSATILDSMMNLELCLLYLLAWHSLMPLFEENLNILWDLAFSFFLFLFYVRCSRRRKLRRQAPGC